MKKLIINGGKKLKGNIKISGAKNAALPIMVASLLSDEELIISNIPHVDDISTMANLLINLGAKFTLDSLNGKYGNTGGSIKLQVKKITNSTAPYDLVRKMRASVLVLGALLARSGKAKVSLPGGCAIGDRPLDMHIEALEKMGAKIAINNGYIEATAENGLKGANINLRKKSVGATENILMAASIAQGKTILSNAACEPEVKDLANCLNSMGANIKGAGTDKIIIDGVKKLKKAEHEIIGDRIEAGTYMAAALMTDGKITLTGINKDLLEPVIPIFEKMGADIKIIGQDTIKIKKKSGTLKAIELETSPYPGFPTDMQAQIVALSTIADGQSKITESIFENRFMHIPELNRMGAKIKTNNHTAIIRGVKNLQGAEVMATDLRASVSLVLAGLVANGKTVINRLYHLNRGYERLEEKLLACGADIELVY